MSINFDDKTDIDIKIAALKFKIKYIENVINGNTKLSQSINNQTDAMDQLELEFPKLSLNPGKAPSYDYLSEIKISEFRQENIAELKLLMEKLKIGTC